MCIPSGGWTLYFYEGWWEHNSSTLMPVLLHTSMRCMHLLLTLLSTKVCILGGLCMSATAASRPSGRASTHMKALWRRARELRLERTMLVLDLRSWVLEVTEAVTWPLLSRSMMMRFFDSCSWIRITFSVPRTTK